MQAAGKITILTAFTGVLVFIVAFLFDAGTQQLGRFVSATSTATTTLTVLNTPPTFAVNAYELTDSSTSTPINSGSVMQWRAVATDSNGAPYFLLICDTNASPTATLSTTTLGTAKPVCGGGATRWGVSSAAASGAAATVSTTTSESGQFAGGSYSGEKHNWYAWVCDDDPVNARCNTVPVQGPTSTSASSSPWHINKRPVINSFTSNQPVNPGATLTFSSNSSDPDTIGGEDNIYLVVCQTNGGFNTSTRTCTSNHLATTTGSVTANATAAYTLASIVRDDTYASYGYLVDQHGHVATSTPAAGPSAFLHNFVVNNVAPTLLSGDINLNGGNDITLSVPGDETTGYTLTFAVRDANSCLNASSGNEIADYDVVVYRSGVGTTSCNWNSNTYDPNKCYTNAVATTTWNLSCTQVGGSCTGATDPDVQYSCTFPLWFVADPTDAGIDTPAALQPQYWLAAARGIDDDGATSTLVATSQNTVDLISFTALDLLTASIPYNDGAGNGLEPGDDTGAFNATTTVNSVGNTGLDQRVEGESMCGTFAIGNECNPSSTSTIPESQQQFSSSTFSYGAGVTLSSSTVKEVELDVPKTTSTTTLQSGVTYWGIGVPLSISLAGAYTGQNTFYAKTAEEADWAWTP
ncbi:MAG: hypothetical protein RL538_196 [Candidatus Parcubacteria bacterium]